jgi:hypothetical protein
MAKLPLTNVNFSADQLQICTVSEGIVDAITIPIVIAIIIISFLLIAISIFGRIADEYKWFILNAVVLNALPHVNYLIYIFYMPPYMIYSRWGIIDQIVGHYIYDLSFVSAFPIAFNRFRILRFA